MIFLKLEKEIKIYFNPFSSPTLNGWGDFVKVVHVSGLCWYLYKNIGSLLGFRCCFFKNWKQESFYEPLGQIIGIGLWIPRNWIARKEEDIFLLLFLSL